MTHVRLLAVALAAVSVGWLDPFAKAREAAHLYKDGKYDDAVAQYNDALTDQPESALLHFNLGDAAYKQGKYTDALNAFQQVPADDPARTARAAYNIGNVKYRFGEAAEGSDPKAALGLYAEALVAYRRAMGADPDDTDAKFNHEFVEKKIADLKKKLEEQQKQKNQQNSDNQDNQDQQQPQSDEQKKDEKKEDQQAEQQKPDQPQEQQQKQQDQGAAQEKKGRGEQKQGEMNQNEAAALLDSQRGQEVRPDEVAKRLQGPMVAEPAQDW